MEVIPQKSSAQAFKIVCIGQNSQLSADDGPAVVEHTKNKDGVQAFAQWKEEEDPVRYTASFTVDGTGERERQYVQSGVYLLSQAQMGSIVGQVMEDMMYEYMASWISARSQSPKLVQQACNTHTSGPVGPLICE